MIVRLESFRAFSQTSGRSRPFSAYNEPGAASPVICSVKTQPISPFLLGPREPRRDLYRARAPY